MKLRKCSRTKQLLKLKIGNAHKVAILLKFCHILLEWIIIVCNVCYDVSSSKFWWVCYTLSVLALFTVWFKINLILFKSQIFHKWDKIINIFEDIYKLWYLRRMWWKWHQNRCSNTEMGVIFRQIVKNSFTHTKSEQSCWRYSVLQSSMVKSLHQLQVELH